MKRPSIVAAVMSLTVSLMLLAAPTNASTPGTTVIPFPTTNGVVLTAVMMQIPQQVLVIGGNFTQVKQPDGTTVPAKNLAAIDVTTNTVVYAGNVNSYVRNVAAAWGKLYIAGNFTTVNGTARPHVAQLDAYTRALTSWKPSADPGVVNTIAVSQQGVFYGSSSKLVAVRPDNAAQIWSLPVTQGPVRTLLLSPDESGLFVGGQFEKINGYTQHGLVEIYPILSGTIYTPFHPLLLPDSEAPPQPGGRETWDGEENLRLAWDWSSPQLRLVMGDGGGTINAVRSINPADGVGYWGIATEGDVQGLAMNGNTVIAGWHRNHGNTTTGLPYAYFGGAFTNNGALTSWDPKLSGQLDTTDAAKGHGGVQDVVVTADRVYVLGDFTTQGSTCSYPTCSGGQPRGGIAVFPAS